MSDETPEYEIIGESSAAAQDVNLETSLKSAANRISVAMSPHDPPGALRYRWVSGFLALCILSAILVSCQTGGADSGKYVRNGVRYGTTENLFSRNWWNYYERGRSFQDGGFLAEAGSDFRTAIGQRSKDQRWARTYGLHFLPEYFPVRELGITYYQQGNTEEAVQYLEESIAQIHTARAATYLDEARRDWVSQNSLDRLPPTFQLTQESFRRTLAGTFVAISGVASDDTFVVSVVINGKPFHMDVSSSEVAVEEFEVQLAAGDNVISVIVTDIAGKVYEDTIEYYADIEGPAISFDEPSFEGDLISGVVYDTSGVRELLIDGIAATLTEGPGGVVNFEVRLGTTSSGKPVPWVATDNLGNETSGVYSADDFGTNPSAQYLPVSGEIVFAVDSGARGQESVRFLNPLTGQVYNIDQVEARIEIASKTSPLGLRVNGERARNMIPGRKNQVVPHILYFSEEGKHPVVAELTELSGVSERVEVVIERKYKAAEIFERKLSIVFLGKLSDGTSQEEKDNASFVLSNVRRALVEEDRFALLNPPTIDEESQEGRIPAEITIVISSTHLNEDSFEIVFEIVDTMSGERIGYIDGTTLDVSRAGLDSLVDVLVNKIEQMFPRVKGQVTRVQSNNLLFVTLANAESIQEYARCFVYREERIVDPNTGALLDTKKEILAEGWVERESDGQFTLNLQQSESGEFRDDIGVGDFVATK
ncbi:MAG TPA: tetratricopeptide repeat protein [Candidatus Hydrogenedentes bacterium]|nr:tetratricopeptide repeat protein [Candidatus Hydrogenedentota bacterium]